LLIVKVGRGHLLLTPANGHDNVQEHADVLLERGA
jgi:hypothetical protein